jgi:hypothetical protein
MEQVSEQPLHGRIGHLGAFTELLLRSERVLDALSKSHITGPVVPGTEEQAAQSRTARRAFERLDGAGQKPAAGPTKE